MFRVILCLKQVPPMKKQGLRAKRKSKVWKEERGERISDEIRPLLEGFFLAGNVNKSGRYTTHEMYQELKDLVNSGILEPLYKIGYLVTLPSCRKQVRK
jgi:hypothetical protein